MQLLMIPCNPQKMIILPGSTSVSPLTMQRFQCNYFPNPDASTEVNPYPFNVVLALKCPELLLPCLHIHPLPLYCHRCAEGIRSFPFSPLKPKLYWFLSSLTFQEQKGDESDTDFKITMDGISSYKYFSLCMKNNDSREHQNRSLRHFLTGGRNKLKHAIKVW